MTLTEYIFAEKKQKKRLISFDFLHNSIIIANFAVRKRRMFL